jgi:predicted transcriptional regulator
MMETLQDVLKRMLMQHLDRQAKAANQETSPPPKTWIISVSPRWAKAFFAEEKPKTIELRKGNFGASLKAGDSIVIYATIPVAEIIGIVQFMKRESLPIEQLWEESEQGKMAKVSRTQFDAYYANQESGIGVWVGVPELFPRPIALSELRQNFGERWQPPQQLQRLSENQQAIAKYLADRPENQQHQKGHKRASNLQVVAG